MSDDTREYFDSVAHQSSSHEASGSASETSAIKRRLTPSLRARGIVSPVLPEKDKARQDVMANTLNLFRNGAPLRSGWVRHSLLGHDGSRVNFHEEIRIRQAWDEDHGDRRRVRPIAPCAPECVKARPD